MRLARAASRVQPRAAAAQVPPATREVAVNRKLVLLPPVAPSEYHRHCQGSDGTVGADTQQSEGEWAEMSCSDCKHSARMRLPPPASAKMRARRMIGVMKGKEHSGTRIAVTES